MSGISGCAACAACVDVQTWAPGICTFQPDAKQEQYVGRVVRHVLYCRHQSCMIVPDEFLDAVKRGDQKVALNVAMELRDMDAMSLSKGFADHPERLVHKWLSQMHAKHLGSNDWRTLCANELAEQWDFATGYGGNNAKAPKRREQFTTKVADAKRHKILQAKKTAVIDIIEDFPQCSCVAITQNLLSQVFKTLDDAHMQTFLVPMVPCVQISPPRKKVAMFANKGGRPKLAKPATVDGEERAAEGVAGGEEDDPPLVPRPISPMEFLVQAANALTEQSDSGGPPVVMQHTPPPPPPVSAGDPGHATPVTAKKRAAETDAEVLRDGMSPLLRDGAVQGYQTPECNTPVQVGSPQMLALGEWSPNKLLRTPGSVARSIECHRSPGSVGKELQLDGEDVVAGLEASAGVFFSASLPAAAEIGREEEVFTASQEEAARAFIGDAEVGALAQQLQETAMQLDAPETIGEEVGSAEETVEQTEAAESEVGSREAAVEQTEAAEGEVGSAEETVEQTAAAKGESAEAAVEQTQAVALSEDVAVPDISAIAAANAVTKNTPTAPHPSAQHEPLKVKGLDRLYVVQDADLTQIGREVRMPDHSDATWMVLAVRNDYLLLLGLRRAKETPRELDLWGPEVHEVEVDGLKETLAVVHPATVCVQLMPHSHYAVPCSTIDGFANMVRLKDVTALQSNPEDKLVGMFGEYWTYSGFLEHMREWKVAARQLTKLLGASVGRSVQGERQEWLVWGVTMPKPGAEPCVLLRQVRGALKKLPTDCMIQHDAPSVYRSGTDVRWYADVRASYEATWLFVPTLNGTLADASFEAPCGGFGEADCMEMAPLCEMKGYAYTKGQRPVFATVWTLRAFHEEMHKPAPALKAWDVMLGFV